MQIEARITYILITVWYFDIINIYVAGHLDSTQDFQSAVLHEAKGRSPDHTKPRAGHQIILHEAKRRSPEHTKPSAGHQVTRSHVLYQIILWSCVESDGLSKELSTKDWISKTVILNFPIALSLISFTPRPVLSSPVDLSSQGSSTYIVARQWRAEGGAGCDGPGHPAGGHPTREFLKKCVGKCLKLSVNA